MPSPDPPPLSRFAPIALALALFCGAAIAIAQDPPEAGAPAEEPKPAPAEEVPEPEKEAEDAAPADPAEAGGGERAGEAAPLSTKAIAERAKKSIVKITQGGRSELVGGTGTGFAVGDGTLIATNLHVAGESRAIQIELPGGDILDAAAVHAWDRKLDLAILKLPGGRKLPPLDLGDSAALPQGEEIVALGNPLGFKYSVVDGVVSAIREFGGQEMIQVAIPIEPGNSGGPLLDRQMRVQGIITMKSLQTDNLGFAVPINRLKLLLDRPNSVPMDAWLTIGALDADRWAVVGGGTRWTQRAGTINADGVGAGFGGRSLCLSADLPPGDTYEVEVQVKLDDEGGAAGLAFAADGGDAHYGFYPSAGELRLTRFDGPDVFSWTILEQLKVEAYRRDDWNHLRVRVEPEKLTCWVNGALVAESGDVGLRGGKVGLAKFRQTVADFRGFRVAKRLSAERDAVAEAQLAKRIEEFALTGLASEALLDSLKETPNLAHEMLLQHAQELEQRIADMRKIAAQAHYDAVDKALASELAKDEGEIDLFYAALLIAKHDNPDLDVAEYRREVARMAAAAREAAGEADDPASLRNGLSEYLFNRCGFHGSRGDYYHASNSYLNEVIDDREGIPITLSVLYIELARQIGIPGVTGAPVPGHFLVRHDIDGTDPVFIDAFDYGNRLDRAGVEELAGMALEDEHLQPSPKKDIVLRMLRNLIGLHLDGETPEDAIPYLNTALTIDSEDAESRLHRGLLRFRTGQNDGAKEDIGWLLENQPPGVNVESLKELYRRL